MQPLMPRQLASDPTQSGTLDVLYLSHKNPVQEDEGAKIVIMGTLRHIAALGCQITLVCLDADGSSDAPLKPFCREIHMIRHPRPGKTKSLVRSLISSLPYSVLVFESQRFRDVVIDLVSRRNFDVVHIETALMYQYAACLRGLPVVLRHHNLEGELLNQQASAAIAPLRKTILSWQANSLMNYERAATSSAALSVAITELDRQMILNHCGSNTPVQVIPSGIEAPETLPAAATDHCIVFSGRMEWAPNADAAAWFAVRVFPQIRRAFPRVEFYIVGGNPGRSTRALAGNGIIVTGFVESIREYLDKAAACVVPLSSGSGMRLKILQAMARGKAIVSTTKGAEGIDCHNNQDIILADNEEDFAASVVTLLANPALRNKLGSAAFNTVKQKYAWDAVGSRFVHCYRTVAWRKMPRVIEATYQ